MDARIKQSGYLAQVIINQHKITNLPVVIMGLTFKPETNLTLDSPSLLLIEQLEESGEISSLFSYDPIIQTELPIDQPSLYVIATNHEQFKRFPWSDNSIIVDPWRIFDETPSPFVSYRPIGGVDKHAIRWGMWNQKKRD